MKVNKQSVKSWPQLECSISESNSKGHLHNRQQIYSFCSLEITHLCTMHILLNPSTFSRSKIIRSRIDQMLLELGNKVVKSIFTKSRIPISKIISVTGCLFQYWTQINYVLILVI